MYSAGTDSNSFSHIKVNVLCPLPLHSLITALWHLCAPAACLHTAIWEEWRSYCGCLEGTNMSAAMSPTFLRTITCVITSVHDFISWGPNTGCNRRNVRDFGRVFLMLNYTDITQNTYIQSWTVTEIMPIEMCGLLGCQRTVRPPTETW